MHTCTNLEPQRKIVEKAPRSLVQPLSTHPTALDSFSHVMPCTGILERSAAREQTTNGG